MISIHLDRVYSQRTSLYIQLDYLKYDDFKIVKLDYLKYDDFKVVKLENL